jgi:hypothetical protein
MASSASSLPRFCNKQKSSRLKYLWYATNGKAPYDKITSGNQIWIAQHNPTLYWSNWDIYFWEHQTEDTVAVSSKNTFEFSHVRPIASPPIESCHSLKVAGNAHCTQIV